MPVQLSGIEERLSEAVVAGLNKVMTVAWMDFDTSNDESRVLFLVHASEAQQGREISVRVEYVVAGAQPPAVP